MAAHSARSLLKYLLHNVPAAGRSLAATRHHDLDPFGRSARVGSPMRPTAVLLIVMMLAGCATVTHPSSPGVQYASMDQCQNQHIMDSPGDCAKMLHGEATKEAVGIGATILVVLGYFALIGFIIAGGR
jgi:hypothetical protein